jgi:Ca2+:H+ antiporter
MTISTFPVYLCYLVFQLFSHKNIYDDDHADVQQSVQYPPRIAKRLHIYGSAPSSSSPPPIDGMMVTAQPDVSLETGWDSEEEVEIPQIHLQTAIALHVILTAVCRRLIFLECLWSDRAAQLIAVTAEFLVDSIDGLTSSGHISKGFVGLILLPILGSAASMFSRTLIVTIFPRTNVARSCRANQCRCGLSQR